MTTLQFALNFPANAVTDLSISSTNPAVGAAILMSSTPTQAVFNVNALSGRLLLGPANIADVCFEASTAHSAFVSLFLNGIQGTQPGGGLVGNSSGQSGQLIEVAAEPLLQAGVGTNSTLMITLYGNPGSNYVIQSVGNLESGNWQSNMNVTVSNVVTEVPVGGNHTNAAQFFRAYQH